MLRRGRARRAGKYLLPQAYVEDMYNPSRYGRTSTETGKYAARNEQKRED